MNNFILLLTILVINDIIIIYIIYSVLKQANAYTIFKTDSLLKIIDNYKVSIKKLDYELVKYNKRLKTLEAFGLMPEELQKQKEELLDPIIPRREKNG